MKGKTAFLTWEGEVRGHKVLMGETGVCYLLLRPLVQFQP